MHITAYLAVAAAQCLSLVSAGFSPTYWNTGGPTDTNTPIVKVRTVLQVPPLLSYTVQNYFPWPGVFTTDANSLVQTVLANAPEYLSLYCHTSENRWCVVSYSYNGVNDGNDPTGVLVNPGDMIEITYTKYGNYWVQQSRLNGEVLTDLCWPGGDGFALGMYVECHENVANTPAHTYWDTTITLEAPNKNFNSTLTGNNAYPLAYWDTYDYITWYIPQITLSASYCKNNS